jgi:parallel beta-helix repeat protein
MAIYIITVFVLIFASYKMVLVFSGPPPTGDWVVTGTESYYDEVIALNGNLIVEDGGRLTFRNVTLQLNCTSDTHYNITIQTGGEFYVLEGSVITSVDSVNGYSFVVWPDSTFRMSYSEVHYCGWDPSGWHTMGLYILTDDAVVENCLISRNNFFGISFESSAIIRNNNITENKRSGIDCGGEGINPSIYNNYISWNNESGISIRRCSANIYNNTITSNSWVGINPHDAANPMIQNNVITKNGVGIFCVFNSSPTISNNTIAENLDNGISCHSYSSPKIVNNTIASNLGWMGGIKCTEYSNPLIQGNTITNNTHGGIGGGDGSLTILDNSISQNNESGIYLDYSNVTIQNNVISFNDGGIQLGNSNLTIEGNFFSNNNHSIGCAFSSGIIRGNTFTNCGDCIGLHWSSPIIQGNIITTNTGTGIWCTNHSNPTIQGNIITFNIECGISCREGSKPEIHQNDIYGQNNYGLCNEDDSVTVNATYNYWGSESGPALGLPDAVDPEEVNGSVLFNPWLTESIIVAEIANPLQGETVSSTVKISVNARAKNGVSMVEFYIDLQLKYTDFDPPLEWDWDTTQYAETSHEIMVKVIDNFYAFAAQAFRTVFVDNTSPTASIKEPVSGNIYQGTITVNVNATDNREISNVHFKVDNGAWLVMTYNSTDFLWKYDLNTTSLSDGQRTLMVLALDKAGNPATTSITVLIDNNPPTLTIQSPTSGMTVGLTLIVSVQASDASNISRIEFYLQDVLVYTVYNAPYQWSWDTTKYPNGDHTITVKAYDTAGNVKTSGTTVTVKNLELPWWQEHFWTIIQVLVAMGGLILAVLTYITRKKEGKKKED